ncbi:hypothetical protein FH972_026367 [Carpinus fangiana]|uniref:NADP-dependent oxidoreductase domain-containing protein n=1 Tax=Carpinus fangiana TaxID=176857 RepID=A0A5N6L6B7_9ROSI|nr:hypothetical protein FH972_026367 [Carpinus fangiana]
MPALPTHQLGKNGPRITALGFGAMGLSAFYGPKKPDPERFRVLDAAYEAGELFWDTADVYGDNEDLLGAWFKQNPGKRDNIFLATKFANIVHEDGSREVNSTPAYAKSACEKSLKRLGLPYVDLYYCHRLDRKTPIEHTIQAMLELKNEGKIKHIGVSELSAESLRRASKITHIDAVQLEYSPFSLDIEDPKIALLKTCRELGTAVVAYSPIGRGMLSGEIKSLHDLPEGDFRRNAPRFSEENFPKNLKLVKKINVIAERKNVTTTQLALAWLLAQGDDIFPIPGTTRVERLKENLASLQIKLTPEEEKEFRSACESALPAGERYPPASMASLFADTPEA